MQGIVAAEQDSATTFNENSGRTTISGFGTIGGVYSSGSDASMRRSVNQKNEVRKFSMATDSRFGIQVNHRISPQLELLGQMVLRNQIDNSFEKSLSRAFVAYNLTPELRVRAGRMGDSTYLMSDYQDVGYAYPWMRPPESNYSVLPIHNFDGADLSYALSDADTSWRFKLLAGKIKAPMAANNDGKYILESKGTSFGGAIIREQGPLKAWLGYASFKLANGVENEKAKQLKQGLDYVASNSMLPAPAPYPSGLFIPNPYQSEAQKLHKELFEYPDTRVAYTSLGVTFDDGNWMLQSELSRASSRASTFKVTQGYLSIGHHFGNVLPYALVGFSRSDKTMQAETRWAGELAQIQDGALTMFNSLTNRQANYSLGVRWDIHPQAALKLQIDHVRFKENGWFLWSTKDADRTSRPGSANVVSIGLDFIF